MRPRPRGCAQQTSNRSQKDLSVLLAEFQEFAGRDQRSPTYQNCILLLKSAKELKAALIRFRDYAFVGLDSTESSAHVDTHSRTNNKGLNRTEHVFQRISKLEKDASLDNIRSTLRAVSSFIIGFQKTFPQRVKDIARRRISNKPTDKCLTAMNRGGRVISSPGQTRRRGSHSGPP